jgi:hypothetical protein
MDGTSRNVAKKEDELYGGLQYPFLSFDTSPSGDGFLIFSLQPHPDRQNQIKP